MTPQNHFIVGAWPQFFIPEIVFFAKLHKLLKKLLLAFLVFALGESQYLVNFLHLTLRFQQDIHVFASLGEQDIQKADFSFQVLNYLNLFFCVSMDNLVLLLHLLTRGNFLVVSARQEEELRLG